MEKQQLDNIAALVWPKILEVKRILQTGRKDKALAQEENIILRSAMLCDNSDEPTDALDAFLTNQEENPKYIH